MRPWRTCVVILSLLLSPRNSIPKICTEQLFTFSIGWVHAVLLLLTVHNSLLLCFKKTPYLDLWSSHWMLAMPLWSIPWKRGRACSRHKDQVLPVAGTKLDQETVSASVLIIKDKSQMSWLNYFLSSSKERGHIQIVLKVHGNWLRKPFLWEWMLVIFILGWCSEKMLLGTKRREDDVGMYPLAAWSNLECARECLVLAVQSLMQVSTASLSFCSSNKSNHSSYEHMWLEVSI